MCCKVQVAGHLPSIPKALGVTCSPQNKERQREQKAFPPKPARSLSLDALDEGARGSDPLSLYSLLTPSGVQPSLTSSICL